MQKLCKIIKGVRNHAFFMPFSDILKEKLKEKGDF